MVRDALFLLCLSQLWRLSSGHWTGNFGHSLAGDVNQPCVLKDTCTCVRKDGTGIDLHHLDTAPNPRFTIHSEQSVIEWNPCTGFSIAGFKDVAVAVGFDKSDLFPFGFQKTANFYRLNNTDILSYKTKDSFTRIILVCDEQVKPTFVHESETLTPLIASYHGPCSTKSALSTGTLILIAFFVIIIVYFSMGFVVNIFLRKKTGCERIPNQSFWCGLPSLIKDGFCYTFRRVKPKSSYEEI